ncbi:MAG: type II secretion system protein [Armatimonadota bacterium]
MGVHRREGFTLIELLVVIAIIAVLAAMLLPVFDRARESARKGTCLGKVRDIAVAINMYVADNDGTLPPAEHNQQVIDYIGSQPGGTSCPGRGGYEEFAWRANPFLRWPVILDGYVRNRDVWRCPSAKVQTGATFILPYSDFVGYLQATEGEWGENSALGYGFGPCVRSWPPGWGGAITDSIAQQALAGADATNHPRGKRIKQRSFVQSIAYSGMNIELKVAAVQAPARHVVCADGGTLSDAASPGTIAFPDLCCAECAGVSWYAWGWPTKDCPSGAYCPECPPTKAAYLFVHQGMDWQKTSTRHLGGSNVGFLDGHARWINAQAILTMARDNEITGVTNFCTGGTMASFLANCGDTIPEGVQFLY